MLVEPTNSHSSLFFTIFRNENMHQKVNSSPYITDLTNKICQCYY